MRKLIYSMSVSLDGYIAGPRGEFDWSEPDEELHRFHNDRVRELSMHILGRRLYEVMSYWETAEERNPSAPEYTLEFARIWKALPRIVYSKTLTTVEGNARLSQADPVEEVLELKREPGKDMAVGGADLAAAFMRRNAIDEYQLFVNPVILGGGRPFFASLDERVELELLETRTFSSRVTYLRYARA
ncbi:MAG TPA: dihydrofolate reductase family protein [Solirubrobacterales bacterium]|nr:dihydrofolate reductase family protein [Solirubrobacterales bacterium]